MPLYNKQTTNGSGDVANGSVTEAKLSTSLQTKLNNGGISFTIDAGDSVITTGFKGILPPIPYGGTITKWQLLASESGSIVIDIWKDSFANYPPTIADTITGTEKPTLASEIKAEDTNLTTWATSVTAGDIFSFNVDSVSGIKRVVLLLTISKS